MCGGGLCVFGMLSAIMGTERKNSCESGNFSLTTTMFYALSTIKTIANASIGLKDKKVCELFFLLHVTN